MDLVKANGVIRDQAKIFKSLVVIGIVVFGGYLIDTANGMILPGIIGPYMQPTPNVSIETQWYLYNWSLLAIGVAAASNGPLLYFTRWVNETYIMEESLFTPLLCRSVGTTVSASPWSGGKFGERRSPRIQAPGAPGNNLLLRIEQQLLGNRPQRRRGN